MLLGEYFNIDQIIKEDSNNLVYIVSLNPNHKVYKGHFPEMPVCPGVCNIQMIKECIEKETGKNLLMKNISQCKFLSLITPNDITTLRINIQLILTEENSIKTKTRITNIEQSISYIDFKGEFIEK